MSALPVIRKTRTFPFRYRIHPRMGWFSQSSMQIFKTKQVRKLQRERSFHYDTTTTRLFLFNLHDPHSLHISPNQHSGTYLGVFCRKGAKMANFTKLWTCVRLVYPKEDGENAQDVVGGFSFATAEVLWYLPRSVVMIADSVRRS